MLLNKSFYSIYNIFIFSEKINEIPHEVTVHLSQKRYLSATNLLIEGVNLSNGNLEKVEGLKELTSELHQRKDVNFLNYLFN